MRKLIVPLLVAYLSAAMLAAQEPLRFSSELKKFISVSAPVVVLTHVRVVDGTGVPPLEDQTIVIRGGKIESLRSSAQMAPPAGATVLDRAGYTIIPGLVGMHDHLFYPAGGRTNPAIYNEMGFSAPRLYLACGVTSLRTTGSIEPYTDLELKKLINRGEIPGPKIHVTGPYLEGAGAFTPQMHVLTSPEDARKTVNYWADEGVTSFKAYMNITHAELAAAVEEAHKRGLKVTGHLCSVGFREAAVLGIDDLEHGLLADTEFVPGKSQDVCPPSKDADESLIKLDLSTEDAQATIRDLVAHHVAVTSTLPVFETFVPNRPPLDQRVLDAMVAEARVSYLATRARVSTRTDPDWAALFKKEMEFERGFVKAGGLLLAGNDPTGYGGDLAGFGDQREVELLVEAGFTPVEAIHIASANGAAFLGEADRIGTIAPGKAADLILIHGDPSKDIEDIEKVEIVFKDGVGYDSAKLIESVRGSMGLH
jgi:imidazolonepropionase-like amidohydrolase